MSGGYFNYNQNYIEYIIEDIERLLKKNPDYLPCTLKAFETALVELKRAKIYTQRIDWLLSGDDGELSFHERLDEELKQLETPDA